MQFLRIFAIIGLLPGMFLVTWPYLPVQAGPFLLLAVMLNAGAIIVIALAPKEGTGIAKYIVVALIPWLIGAFALANGALDRSPEVIQHTEVVRSDYGWRNWTQVTVRSWRPGRAQEVLYLPQWRTNGAGFYLQGEPLTLGTKSGALGLRWISTLVRDRHVRK